MSEWIIHAAVFETTLEEGVSLGKKPHVEPPSILPESTTGACLAAARASRAVVYAQSEAVPSNAVYASGICDAKARSCL